MLVTTSRKPSQRTRTFCRGLERVSKTRCVNRGKMSLRDVFLKSRELGTNLVAVISEKNGNPNGMEIYEDGVLFATLKLAADLSLPKGRIKKDETCLRCEVDELKGLASKIFEIPLENSEESKCNFLWIKTHQRKSTPVMEFFDRDGKPTMPRIHIYECKLHDEADENTKTSRSSD
ncbi:MAG: Brix domain-containing protein [Methanobacterium sp.]|jgi:U3 small nucleolar ribonucleoprotein protein IMP4